jgi:hypothetical protein
MRKAMGEQIVHIFRQQVIRVKRRDQNDCFQSLCQLIMSFSGVKPYIDVSR